MYIYLYIDVAMTILALVDLLKMSLFIIEKCQKTLVHPLQWITSVYILK